MIKWISGIAAAVILILAFCSWGTVTTGHRGVVLRMGKVTGEVKGEGFYTKAPWIESVIEMDVRIQKEQVETEGASKDLQTVSTTIACNLSLLEAKVADVYQTIGRDYQHTVVEPAMQESIKAVLARYTAEQLISQREVVRADIVTLLKSKLEPVGIKTDAINIVDFDFSPSFNQAIEAKVTAEQSALAAQNKLAQVKFEAEQQIAEAKGKAEAMVLEAQAMKSSPEILQLRALEKWDGRMPQVTGGAMPFIDVKTVMAR